MTFEKFSSIVSAHRSDTIVSRGVYGFNATPCVFVQFVNNGKLSRSYTYTGSYATILRKLCIEFATPADFANAEYELQFALEMVNYNADNDPFAGAFDADGEEIDLAEWQDRVEIARNRLAYLKSLPLID